MNFLINTLVYFFLYVSLEQSLFNTYLGIQSYVGFVMAILNTNMLINSSSFETRAKGIFKILIIGVLVFFTAFSLIYFLIDNIFFMNSGGNTFLSFIISIGVISNSILSLKMFNKSSYGDHNLVIVLLILETILRGFLVIILTVVVQDIYLIIVASLLPSIFITLILISKDKNLIKIYIYKFYQTFFVKNSLPQLIYLISFSLSNQGIFFLYVVLSNLYSINDLSLLYILIARLVASLVLSQQYLFLDNEIFSKIQNQLIKYLSYRNLFFLSFVILPFLVLFPVQTLLIFSTLQFTYFVFLSNIFVSKGKILQTSKFWLSHIFLIVLLFFLGTQLESINPFYFSYFFTNLISFFIFIHFFKVSNLSIQG
jgi:hypothetical protein